MDYISEIRKIIDELESDIEKTKKATKLKKQAKKDLQAVIDRLKGLYECQLMRSKICS